MPRKEVNPLLKSLDAFETASIDQAEFALQVAGQIVKRRKNASMTLPYPVTPVGPKPNRKKRGPRKPVNTATPIAPTTTTPSEH